MANDVLMAPGAYDADAENIRRRQAYAQALMQQSQQMPQGQMVSGHYVAPSWTQGMANMLKAYAGRKTEDQATSDMEALAGKRREEATNDATAFARALTPQPAVNSFPDAGMGAESYQMQPQPEKPASMDDALLVALKSRSPLLNQMGSKIMEARLGQVLPKQTEWALGERFNEQTGRPEKFMYNKANPTQQMAIGGTQAEKLLPVNGQLVGENSGAPKGAAIPKQPEAPNPGTNLVIPGADGTMVPNIPLIDARKAISAAGATKMINDNRNYATQESEQAKKYGASLGDMRATINQAGYDAPGKLAQLKRMEELLDGVDGGKAAPTLASIASLAQSVGIKLDPKLGVKQAAEALARDMAGSLRKPGTGPMTDKDFDNFLTQIPDLSKTAEGRKQIMVTMRSAIERDRRAAQFSRDYAKKNGGVIDDNFFDSLAGFYAENPVTTPAMPAGGSSGRVFKVLGKE